MPPDEEALGVSRRQFLNRATVSLTGASLTTFAAAGFVAFLWPTAKGGFGGKINVGKIDDVISSIQSSGGFFYNDRVHDKGEKTVLGVKNPAGGGVGRSVRMRLWEE